MPNCLFPSWGGDGRMGATGAVRQGAGWNW